MPMQTFELELTTVEAAIEYYRQIQPFDESWTPKVGDVVQINQHPTETCQNPGRTYFPHDPDNFKWVKGHRQHVGRKGMIRKIHSDRAVIGDEIVWNTHRFEVVFFPVTEYEQLYQTIGYHTTEEMEYLYAYRIGE